MRRSDGRMGGRSLILLFVLAGTAQAQSARPSCAADNAGLTLPPGFCAQVVADSVGRSRHIVALANGDLAVALEGNAGGVMVLHDADGDGIMETRRKFGPRGGTGIAIYHDYLY